MAAFSIEVFEDKWKVSRIVSNYELLLKLSIFPILEDNLYLFILLYTLCCEIKSVVHTNRNSKIYGCFAVWTDLTLKLNNIKQMEKGYDFFSFPLCWLKIWYETAQKEKIMLFSFTVFSRFHLILLSDKERKKNRIKYF